ncbi:Hypothetical protein NTJ_06729 [Nesidiocoris tenuis]|uniref:Uncharacterized protein n=1 Tax=Nesidiocoris tenuis TaxID=355587 RepID=A0ABN7ANX8_9HEMI|nr:Hypothetical protein NTJ_06729 [Nesidiocoris tenuis]
MMSMLINMHSGDCLSKKSAPRPCSWAHGPTSTCVQGCRKLTKEPRLHGCQSRAKSLISERPVKIGRTDQRTVGYEHVLTVECADDRADFIVQTSWSSMYSMFASSAMTCTLSSVSGTNTCQTPQMDQERAALPTQRNNFQVQRR